MLVSGIFGVLAMYNTKENFGNWWTMVLVASVAPRFVPGQRYSSYPSAFYATDYKNVVFFGWYPYGYNKLHLLQMPINLLSIFRRYLSLINLGFLVTWWISPSRKSLSPFIYRIYSNKRPTSN